MSPSIRHRAAEPSALFAALGDRTRLALVRRLATERALSVTALTEGTRISRQAVTKHLNILEAANLVATIWRGREKLHYLNPVPIHEIAERWIGKFERGRPRALADLKQKLEGETDG